MSNYGTINHNGTTITLTTIAVCDNYQYGVAYTAKGQDAEGNEYSVMWLTTDAWDMAQERCTLRNASLLSDEEAERLAELEEMVLPDVSDESDACDWDDVYKVVAL